MYTLHSLLFLCLGRVNASLSDLFINDSIYLTISAQCNIPVALAPVSAEESSEHCPNPRHSPHLAAVAHA